MTPIWKALVVGALLAQPGPAFAATATPKCGGCFANVLLDGRRRERRA